MQRGVENRIFVDVINGWLLTALSRQHRIYRLHCSVLNRPIIISLCVKSQSTGQQPRQQNARRAARQEIEFLCSHRLLCDIVRISQQLQRGSEDCFQRTMLAEQRPCPVLERFNQSNIRLLTNEYLIYCSTHFLRGISWPGGQTDGTGEWFTTSVAEWI